MLTDLRWLYPVTFVVLAAVGFVLDVTVWKAAVLGALACVPLVVFDVVRNSRRRDRD